MPGVFKSMLVSTGEISCGGYFLAVFGVSFDLAEGQTEGKSGIRVTISSLDRSDRLTDPGVGLSFALGNPFIFTSQSSILFFDHPRKNDHWIRTICNSLVSTIDQFFPLGNLDKSSSIDKFRSPFAWTFPSQRFNHQRMVCSPGFDET